MKRAVAYIVVRPARQSYAVLLLRQTVEPWSGKWFFVEGLVERGESPSAAALRELAEETRLSPAEFYLEEREPRVVPASTSRVIMHVFVALVPRRNLPAPPVMAATLPLAVWPCGCAVPERG